MQIVRFPRLVYYRNHERSDVIYLASSGIWTASHFAFAVLSVLFSFSKLRGRRPRQSIPRLVYYRNHERSDAIHLASSGTVDCFTLRVRSFEVLFSFSKLRGSRPRQSIPRLVYYRNHERSDVIHFTLSGTVDCFTLRVRSFECFIFFFEIARPQAAAIHSPFGILSKPRMK